MIKKILTVMCAVMMVAAMSVTSFAESSDVVGDGVVGDFTTADTPLVLNDGAKVILRKEITAFNPETCIVNAPTITYKYSVAPGSANKNIYDVKTAHDPETNAHVATKAGVGTPVIKGSVDGSTWTDDSIVFTPSVQLNASEDGTKNGGFKVEIDFSGIDYKTAGSGAGVYRYEITEHVNTSTTAEGDTTAKNAAGIKEGTITGTRYMDVYVDGNGDVYGYVLFKNNLDIDARDASNNLDEVEKTEGFVADEDDNDPDTTEETADEYYTFNFEVGKTVENDAYSKTNHHQFPFTVTLANTNVTADVLPIMTVGTNATQTALSAAPIAGTWNPTIADGATVKYVGVPCGTTVSIYETNDVTGVTYNSSSDNADSDAAAKYIDTGANSNTATINCGATALASATENHTTSDEGAVIFTNTLTQISPTGLAIRFAIPFALLIMGIALYMLKKDNKENSAAR